MTPTTQVLQVGAFEAVALPAEQLEVVHCGGTAQSHRDDVVVLKIELASALGALPAIAFEHGPADLAGDGSQTSTSVASAGPLAADDDGATGPRLGCDLLPAGSVEVQQQHRVAGEGNVPDGPSVGGRRGSHPA